MNQNRIEKKFIYSEGDESFKLFIINAMFKETFKPRIVNSIYFDTPVFTDVWDNINGFGNRKKIRIRWYDEINQSAVFIEEKKKISSVTQKTTNKLGNFKDYNELNDFITNENFFKQKFILNKKLNLKKTIFIQYKRSYFELPNQKLRLTIDRDLKIFNSYPLNFIDLNKIIIELKYNTSQASFVNDFIFENKLNNRNQKFSKYVNSFTELNNSGLI
jgi:SPX domain protein involved in polyphosphate accumulation